LKRGGLTPRRRMWRPGENWADANAWNFDSRDEFATPIFQWWFPGGAFIAKNGAYPGGWCVACFFAQKRNGIRVGGKFAPYTVVRHVGCHRSV